MVAVSSIQTGTFTLGSADLSTTETISAVVLANTILWTQHHGGMQAPNANHLALSLTSTTEITAERASTSSAVDQIIKWWVIEFSSGVDVQNITDTDPDNTETITISSVTTSNTFINFNGSTAGGTNWDQDHFLRTVLTNSTTITHNESVSGIDLTEWRAQVVESSDFDVQQVSDLSWTATSSTTHDDTFDAIAAIPSAFTTFTMEGDQTDRSMDHYSWRNEITSTTNFRLVRWDGTDSATHSTTYFIVEPTDNTSIQYAEGTIATGSTITDTIDSVDTNNTSCMGTGMMGHPAGATARTDDNFGFHNCQVILTNATTVTFDRQSSAAEDSSHGAWVVEWDTAAAGRIMGSLAGAGGLAGVGGIAGEGGGIAG